MRATPLKEVSIRRARPQWLAERPGADVAAVPRSASSPGPLSGQRDRQYVDIQWRPLPRLGVERHVGDAVLDDDSVG